MSGYRFEIERTFPNFEDWTKEALENKRFSAKVWDVERRKVSGFDAVSFSAWRDFYPAVSTRETWIGVPETKSSGTVYRFYLTTHVSGPKRDANLILYEKMLASMRLSPRALDEGLSKSEPCPR